MPQIMEVTKQVEVAKAVRNDSSCLYTFDSDMNWDFIWGSYPGWSTEIKKHNFWTRLSFFW